MLFTISTIILSLCILKKILLFINNLLIFKAKKISMNNLDFILQKHKIKKEIIMTQDNCQLIGGLTNVNRDPSYDDIIFLYSHGNSVCLEQVVENDTIYMLSNYGSVFIYDYRGFGASTGKLSEKCIYVDVITIWQHLLKKNIKPENIILYGHSLGSSIVSHLLNFLIKNNMKLPRALILDAPFSTLKDMANTMFPYLEYLIMYNFNNLYNLQEINNKVNICIFHSKIDERIPYLQSIKLKNKTKCNMIDIGGYHSSPIYGKNANDFIKKLCLNF